MAGHCSKEIRRFEEGKAKTTMIVTIFPYIAGEKEFQKFRDADILITFEKAKSELDYSDLPAKQGREDITHRALKKYAKKLLESNGADDVEFESSLIDVSSRKLRVVVECGDTPIYRIWDMLFAQDYGRWIKEVWCVYCIEYDIEIVKFVKPPKLLEYEREIGWFPER